MRVEPRVRRDFTPLYSCLVFQQPPSSFPCASATSCWRTGCSPRRWQASPTGRSASFASAWAPGNVPVTLKMRTGWCASEKNAVRLARAAESAGIAMVAVHGRTREQGYTGQAEYDTVAAVKRALGIPVVANGDIDSPQKAREVFAATGADAVMIGRAAQGRPWIFGEIAHFLETGQEAPPPRV